MTEKTDIPWELGEVADEAQVAGLIEVTKMPKALCEIMARRGIKTAEEARGFLKPSIGALRDPYLMKDMDGMVEALMAVHGTPGRKIGIHGDYDADGLTSTSLLTLGLRELGFDPTPFVPDRVKDGYGVSVDALRKFKADGITTVLTCDTGISAAEEIRIGTEELGLRILVSDHHTAPEVLPNIDVIVNPQQKDCSYPFKGLCGVGVAYKILQALCRRMGVDEAVILHKHLDLVAIGTICDVMPLTDENRIFVRWGLRQARITRNEGLKALFDRMGLTSERIDERVIGWQVGPRLNAAGRIDKADKGLNLLLSKDSTEAQKCAEELESINARRMEIGKRIETEASEQAREILAEKPDRAALALFAKEGTEAWNPGIMGIIAPRIVSQTGRAVFAFAWDEHGGGWKGSGRAPEGSGMNLYNALQEVYSQGLIAKFGGHAEAAGVTILGNDPKTQAEFSEALDRAVKAQNPKLNLLSGEENKTSGRREHQNEVKVDGELELAEVSTDLAKLVSYFGPFGQANPACVFWVKDCVIESSDVFGKKAGQEDAHVKLFIRQGDASAHVIGWGKALEWSEIAQSGKPVVGNIALQVIESVFRNKLEVRLDAVDVKLGLARECGLEKAQEVASGPSAVEAVGSKAAKVKI